MLDRVTVADDFSHEAVDIAVDYGINGQYVTWTRAGSLVYGG